MSTIDPQAERLQLQKRAGFGIKGSEQLHSNHNYVTRQDERLDYPVAEYFKMVENPVVFHFPKAEILSLAY